MISSHDPDAIYAASEVLWKSTDRGMSWKIISPDLTRNDKTKQTASGGPLTKDITSVEYYDTIFALAESPLRKGELWLGTDDGLVQMTYDDGAHWHNITPAAMPAWSTVSMTEPSHFDPDVAYIAVDRHRLDDIAPYAWKTSDKRKTWASIAAGLPTGAVVLVAREDPVRRGLLYAGTELGLFASFNDGVLWSPLQRGLPVTPIHDLAVHDADLIAATHGRGFWILDDVTPLRQAKASAAELVLYSPETALRLHYPDQVNSRRPVGANPPAGALLDYAACRRHHRIHHGHRQCQRRSDRISPAPNQQEISRRSGRIKSSRAIWIPAGRMNRLVWDSRRDDPVIPALL